MTEKPSVFEHCELAGIHFNNRILRAATDERMADNGDPTERLIRLYEALAKGGVGAIITGFISVSKDGQSKETGMMMIETDSRIKGLTEVVCRVHNLNTPIICQIAHCGRNGIAGKRFNVNKLSEQKIERVISDFVSAVSRAKQADFDGVELHIAHGYFLSEMVSPHTNKRKDKWGGTTENRLRIVNEIMKRVRVEYPDFPIFAKINGDEIYKDGIHADEAVRIAKLLERSGVNAIEVSCGIDWKQMGPAKGRVPTKMILNNYPAVKSLPKSIKTILKPILPKIMHDTEPTAGYNVPSAVKIKKAVQIPIIAVGGIHDLADIEKTIQHDGIDLVSMCRPLILEPSLVNKFKDKKSTAAKCLSCNYCLIGKDNEPLRCYFGKC